MSQTYNVLKIYHKVKLENSCMCQVKEQFAAVEVLFEKLTKEEVIILRLEIEKSNEMYQNNKAMHLKSNFRGFSYSYLKSLYVLKSMNQLMIIEML